MKFKCLFALLALAGASLFAAQQQYSLLESNGSVIISFTNKYPLGVSTLEGRLDKPWVPLQNFYTTQLVGQVTLPLPPGYSEYRVRHVSIAPGNAFRNLAVSYGDLSTVAGIGPVVPPGTNAWLPEYEGAPATTVPLSNPRAVVADLYGHVYVLEKDSHALSVIDGTNGTYHTAVAPLDIFGVRGPGSIGLDFGIELSARQITLNNPSGLFYRDERIYLLDAGNGRVLRYTNGLASPTNGTVKVLFIETNFFGIAPITNGGGLWVSADETEAFYTDGKVLKRWEADDGVTIVPTPPFVDLAAITVAPQFGNDIFVADRGANVVWLVKTDGERQLIAGDGRPFGRKVGEATFVSLAGPSSIQFLPVGGYLLGLDQGTSVWQIDADDNAAKFVFGAPGVHDGDGEWFQKGRTRPKVGNVVSVTLAPADNDILMVENGFVRRINFLRSKP